MMDYFIDIHTHHAIQDRNLYISIRNKFLHEAFDNETSFLSIGCHPWHINENMMTVLKMEFESAIQHQNVIAIGECGLDRVSSTNFALQKEAFNFQMNIALKYDKPIIIHCVRAYSDLLEILKKEKFKGRLILHDYHGNHQQTNELKKFNTWFSFGKSLFSDDQKLLTLFQTIPTSRIFLETDESDYSIEQVYNRAAKLISINVNELKVQLLANFITVFGKELVLNGTRQI